MTRNMSTAVIAILIVAVAILGYYVYREEHKDTVEIQVGPNGLKVQGQ